MARVDSLIDGEFTLIVDCSHPWDMEDAFARCKVDGAEITKLGCACNEHGCDCSEWDAIRKRCCSVASEPTSDEKEALDAGAVTQTPLPDEKDVVETTGQQSWVTRYQPLLDVSWSEDVVNVVVSSQATYFESSEQRIFCLFGEQYPRCYEWPNQFGRAVLVEGSEEGKGLVKAEIGSRSHLFEYEVRSAKLELRHASASPKSDPEKPYKFTKLPKAKYDPQESKHIGKTLWRKGRLKLTKRVDVAEHSFVRAVNDLVIGELAGEGYEDQWAVRSIHRGSYSLWVISMLSITGEIDKQWICHRHPDGSPICAAGRWGRIRPILPERTLPDGWLLHTNESGNRDGTTYLVWFDTSGDVSTMPVLATGGTEAYGEHCGWADSYCVWIEGFWTPFEVLEPPCVRIFKSTLWSAIHVRAQHRWIERKKSSAGADFEPKPGVYSPVNGQWQISDCAVVKKRPLKPAPDRASLLKILRRSKIILKAELMRDCSVDESKQKNLGGLIRRCEKLGRSKTTIDCDNSPGSLSRNCDLMCGTWNVGEEDHEGEWALGVRFDLVDGKLDKSSITCGIAGGYAAD
ncbi:MAG: hypothetical protein GY854_18025 [Deltaproteobacteria bacterium]|nr:hypothetical protein [Deltaproteobacteria bacterium]